MCSASTRGRVSYRKKSLLERGEATKVAEGEAIVHVNGEKKEANGEEVNHFEKAARYQQRKILGFSRCGAVGA